MVSWPPTAVSYTRRSWLLCTRWDTVPHRGHAACMVRALARIRTDVPDRHTPSICRQAR